MRRSLRSAALLPLLAACLAAISPLRAQPASGFAEPQLVVISAVPDRAAGTLTITGLDFGDEPPRITLGLEDLVVVSHDLGRVEALLPASVPAGTHLLIVARGPALAEYDVFHLAVPAPAEASREAPAPPAAPPAAEPGPAGVPGSQGPPGPPGPAGPSGRAELAGRRCPPGSLLAGFDAAGDLLCEPVAALLAPPAPAAPPVPLDPPAAVPPAVATACAGDLAASGAELTAAWGPRIETLAAYPDAREGVIEGAFATARDRDLFALLASEADDRFCFGDRGDRPLRATLELRAPATAGAALCACWGRAGEPCALTRNRCVPATGGSARLSLPMPMVCGARDEGVLELEVRAASAEACATWLLGWAIGE